MIGHWGRSAVCIGAHNSKTREILDKFHNPFFSFAENYNVIIKTSEAPISNKEGVEFYRGVIQKSAHDSSEIDYAIILKLQDEYQLQKDILIIAGLGDVGTAGGAYFLLTHYNEMPFEDETFGVLVEVPSGYESAHLVNFDDVASNFIKNG
jgi:hypothetical protein